MATRDEAVWWWWFNRFLKGNPFGALILSVGFLVTGIIAFPLQAIVYVLVRPWSLWAYRKISYYFSAVMYWHQLMLVHWWSKTDIQLLVDPNDLKHMGKEHSILLLNHKYETDILIITAICGYLGIEGNLRGFAKKSLQYLPIFGWLWKLQEHVFLERNFEKDKSILGNQLISLTKHTDPVTLVLFPEGTRFTEEKHKTSMEIARQKGLPELKHHLLPRTRGFVSCIQTLKTEQGSLPATVYDGLVVMEPGDDAEAKSFSFSELIKGKGPKVSIIIKRYPVNDIPDEDTECANWLHERYQEKDEFMENYQKTGKYFNDQDKITNNNFKSFNLIKLPTPWNVLVFMGALDVATFLFILWHIGKVLMNGNILLISVAVVMVFGGGKAFRMLQDFTKIEKGSAYGQSKVIN